MTGNFPEALKQGRTAMPYQKRRADALRVRHAEAEAKAMAIGNISDVQSLREMAEGLNSDG